MKTTGQKIVITLYVDEKIYNRFREYCKKKRLTMSREAEELLRKYVS